MIRAFRLGVLSSLGALFVSGLASGHVGVSGGPFLADARQEITFSVGHGCEGADTLSVRVEIPEQVVSVRNSTNNLGAATLETNDAGFITAVTWEKPEADLLEADTNYYKLTLRITVPNEPFTMLYFPAHQVCQTADGEQIEVDWDVLVPETEEDHPAPALTILPPRVAGWNKYEVPVDVEDLAVFFADALIVWKDDAAYSANPNTAAQIDETPDIMPLTELQAGDEVWVKY